jgi:hypothetical protein
MAQWGAADGAQMVTRYDWARKWRIVKDAPGK